jgi:hypothetical protein
MKHMIKNDRPGQSTLGLPAFFLIALILLLAVPAIAYEDNGAFVLGGRSDSGQNGKGDSNQYGSDDSNQYGPGDSNQNGGDSGQNGSGDSNQYGPGDSGQNGSGDSNQYGPGDPNQNGPGGPGPNQEVEGCKLHGSWFGYEPTIGDAYWMSTASGQSASAGTLVLEVPGFDITLTAGDPPTATFPDALKITDLRGTWERIDGNTFAFTVLGIVVDESGVTQYIAKLTGTDTLSDECNTMFIENTKLQIYLPQADPFADAPLIGPMPYPDHYGFRMKVDLP